MKYKFIFYRVICVIVLSHLSPLSHAYDFEVDGNYYTVLSTSERTARFDGTQLSGDLTIPETITVAGKTLTIVEIKGGAFKNNTEIQSVTIPQTITNLGEDAMREGLFSKVILPENMVSIGNYAFYNCTNLKDIHLPLQLKELGKYAFYGCTNLESIDFPKNLHSLNYGCFANSGLSLLYIPSNITSIKDFYRELRCFQGCKLESLVFEDASTPISITGVLRSSSSINLKGEFDKNDSIDYVYIGRNIETTCRYEPSVLIGRPDFSSATTIIWGDLCTSMSVTVEDGYPRYPYRVVASVECRKVETIIFGKNLETIAPFDECKKIKKR